MKQQSKQTAVFSNPLLQLSLSMFIFGTIGIFVRHIPFPSSVIALARGGIGMLFLLLVVFLSKQKLSASDIRRNLLPLCLSGFFLGFNWILLFEAYRYTTVATATLCYYLAPVFVILVSPLILKEKLTAKKLICIGIALMGLICVSGVMEGGLPGFAEAKGILLGLGAALLYATVMFLNKKLSPIPAYDKTILQLGSASLVLMPYLLLSGGFSISQLTLAQWLLLGLVGILHTGIAYALYFGAMKDLSAKTMAIFSYLDPVIAVILSAVILQESMTLWGIVGTILILGSALYSELPDRK